MKTKHWRLLLLKGDIPVSLFTTTCDGLIEADLQGSLERSLIRTARQYHRHGQNEDQNHRDLAIGVFMAYAAEPIYDRDYTHIEQVRAVPESAPAGQVEHAATGDVIPVWELQTKEELRG